MMWQQSKSDDPGNVYLLSVRLLSPFLTSFFFFFSLKAEGKDIEKSMCLVYFPFSCLGYLIKLKETYGVSGSPIGLFGKAIQILDHTFVSCYVDMNELD